jgi:putative MATE family efflux protein
LLQTLKKWFAPQDMTLGPPSRRIAEFAIPMIIGNFAQQLYNTADSIIVGRYVGDNALAAVGSASPILNLLLALFVGVATGAGIMVAQHFGAKNREELSRTIGNCLVLSVGASLVLMVAGPLLADPLLRILGTPASIRAWCRDYLVIFFLGSAGFFFYNILAGILRGLGDSLSALGFLLIAAALNVGLDIWFVAGLGMEVAGVALATVLAQVISAALCLAKLLSLRQVFVLGRDAIRPRKKYILTICRLGVPAGLTQAIFSVAMLFVQSLTNSFGELVIACNVIVMRVDGFTMMPNFSFGQAMSTYAGQNLGAGKRSRVFQGARQGTLMALGFAAVLTTLILIFGEGLFALFTDTPQLIKMGARMLRILAVGYLAMAVTQCLGGVMRGVGDTMTPMWISVITTVVIRVPLAYGLAFAARSAEYPVGRPESLYISLLAAWCVGGGLTALAYRFGGWRTRMRAVDMGDGGSGDDGKGKAPHAQPPPPELE